MRRTLLDGMELLLVVKNHLVMEDRGGISLLRFLGQAYDEPNVTALEVALGSTHFVKIRKLDKNLEMRLQAAWRKAALGADMEVELPRVHVCVVAVLG